jgi:uncharacterized protein YndB with AHSA1/START domain
LVRPVTYAAVDRFPAGIDRVFGVLTDPDRIPEWLPGCQAAHSDNPVEKGTRIKARFRARITEFEVTDCVPPNSFAWAERGQRRSSTLGFRLYPVGGSTTVTVSEVWAPTSLAGWVWGRLVSRRNPQRHVALILEKLRTTVGSRTGSGKSLPSTNDPLSNSGGRVL